MPFKRKPTVKSIAKNVRDIKNSIELKYNDNYVNQTVGNDGTDVRLLNGMSQGTSAFTRVGVQVSATSLQFRGQIQSNPDTDTPAAIRLILFWDRQANQAAPVILSSAGNFGLLNNVTVTDPTLSPFAYESNDRYRVLYDKRWIINPMTISDFDPATGDTTTTIPFAMPIKKKIKLSRITKYDNTGNAVDSIVSNSLYAVFVSNVAANEPLVQTGFRFYYKDA